MLETVRTVCIWAGLLLFLATYCILVKSAFSRDTLWGMFALFGPPLGGWAHAATDWFFNSKAALASIAGLAFAAVSAFWFPRPPVDGYWADESGSYVLRIDRDGLVRNYQLEPDGRMHFRGFKILTKELPVKSQTRIKLDGLPNVHVAYLDPRDYAIDMYHEMKDPEVFMLPDMVKHRIRLKRVPDPEGPAFQRVLAVLEQREALQEGAKKLVAREAPAAGAIPASAGLLERYRGWSDAARTMPRAELEKRPLLEQIEVLRFRLVHGEAIRAQAGPEALFARDLSSDYFQLALLRRFNLVDVRVDRALERGMIGVERTLGFGEREYSQLGAERAADGRWGFDLDGWRAEQTREYLRDSIGRPSVERAAQYLRDALKLEVTPAALMPLGG